MQFNTSLLRCFFLIIGCYCCSNLHAQPGCTVQGTVMAGNQPLEFVTVAAYTTSDSIHPVQTTTTNVAGYFTLPALAYGKYKLQYSLIGYAPLHTIIQMQAPAATMPIGTITLQPDAAMLQGITVTTQKKLIEKTAQGFIVNAAATLTAAGGTATDLLKNTPTVSVDAEGAITLRGKAPLIIINGRISKLTNTDQLPASSIETIEIINNANARYDANAESGIINIKLKKNKQMGTNGAIATGAGFGSRGRVNSSLLLNHKTQAWNVGLAYDNRFAGRTRQITGGRTNYFLPDLYLLDQHRNDRRLEQAQNLQLTADFSPNSKHALQLQVIGNLEGKDNNESLNTARYTQSNLLSSNTNRHSIEIARSKTVEGAIDYNKKFDNDKKSLSANISASLSRDAENTSITSQQLDKNNFGIGPPWYQRTHNYEDGKLATTVLDYVVPVSAQGKLAMGYKGIYRSIDANFETADLLNNTYIINTAASNIFHFNEQVQAAYLQWSSLSAGKGNTQWKYEAGLRAEQVNNSGNTQNNSSKFTNSYFKVFPNASLLYYPTASEYIKLSYGKRINRPALGQLNPFTDITDSLNPHSGNPHLQPELIHALELGYSNEWNKSSLSANLFCRYSTNSIRQFAQLLPNGANLTRPVNIGSATTYGIENVYSTVASSYYDLNASVSIFQQSIDGANLATDAVQSAIGWYAKLVNNITPWHNGKLQVTGSYNSALATPQGKRIEQYFVDIGFQQKISKGKGRLGITITDVFNTFENGFNNATAAFTNFRRSKADTRAIIVNFAYFFKSAVKEHLINNQFSKDY